MDCCSVARVKMTLNYLSSWGSCFVFNVKGEWQDMLPHFSPQAENDMIFIISIPFFLYSAILIKRHKHQHYYLDLENWRRGEWREKTWFHCLVSDHLHSKDNSLRYDKTVKTNWNMKRLHVLKVKLDNLSQAPQFLFLLCYSWTH